MAFDVAVYEIERHGRSHTVCTAMMAGIKAAGDRPNLIKESVYREASADIAVFYGMWGNLPKIFADYVTAGKKVVYVDLGYWGRLQGGRQSGYHKVVVNGRHPTEYFQSRKYDASRAASFQIAPQPWKSGNNILLAGMGGKAAVSLGFRPEQWERETIAELRRYTDRTIVYRPKPSWHDAKPIHGVEFSPATQSIEDALANCYAVVTHHSNAAVDGLIAGVPAFCWHGVAKPMSRQDLSKIDNPLRPDGRNEWVAAIAWTQWSVAEIARGAPWRHLKNEGLLS